MNDQQQTPEEVLEAALVDLSVAHQRYEVGYDAWVRGIHAAESVVRALFRVHGCGCAAKGAVEP